MKNQAVPIRPWMFFSVSVVLFASAMLGLIADYRAGAFTGRAVVSSLYALRQMIPHLMMWIALILCSLADKHKRLARLLPMGLFAAFGVLSAVSVCSVSRSGRWVLRPHHSYLFFAYVSDLESIYFLISLFLVVCTVWVIPRGSAKLFRGCTLALAVLCAVSLAFEFALQASSGQFYSGVLLWFASMLFYLLTLSDFARLLTPENRLCYRK